MRFQSEEKCMAQKGKSLDRLHVSSPCDADWETMPGDERVRFCNQCRLNVYNISALTRKQAEKLIAETEGRLCAKLYRRADGTIITRDCPIGIRAIKRRVSHVANAALGAIIGIFANQTSVWAEDGHKDCKHYTVRIVRLQTTQTTSLILGTVSDVMGARISSAKVTIVNEENKREYASKTDAEGKYRFSSLPAGSYSIVVESPGFASFRKKGLKVNEDEALQLDMTMQVGSMGGAAFLPKGLEGGNGGGSRHSTHV
jgi:Carboxypeptidase regulatory-like domain